MKLGKLLNIRLSITLIVIGLMLYLIAATFLIYSKETCRTYDDYYEIKPESAAYSCINLHINSSLSILIESNASVDVYIITKGNLSIAIEEGLSKVKALGKLLDVLRGVINLTIPRSGVYCVVIYSHSDYVLAHVKSRVCSITKAEVGNSIVSLSATVLLIMGFGSLLISLIKSTEKEYVETFKLDMGGSCRTTSMNKHRCVFTSPLDSTLTIKIISDTLVHELGYKLWHKISDKLYVFKKRSTKFMSSNFKDKPRNLIVTVMDLPQGNSSVTLDYEISAWSASGVLDLDGVVNEVNLIIKKLYSLS